MQTKNNSTANAYLRFLQLAKVIQALPDGMEMDANEKALLQADIQDRLIHDNTHLRRQKSSAEHRSYG